MQGGNRACAQGGVGVGEFVWSRHLTRCVVCNARLNACGKCCVLTDQVCNEVTSGKGNKRGHLGIAPAWETGGAMRYEQRGFSRERGVGAVDADKVTACRQPCSDRFKRWSQCRLVSMHLAERVAQAARAVVRSIAMR